MKALLKYQADGEEGNNKSLEEENTLSFIKSRLWYVSVVEFSFESFRLQKFINFFYLNPRNSFSPLSIKSLKRFFRLKRLRSIFGGLRLNSFESCLPYFCKNSKIYSYWNKESTCAFWIVCCPDFGCKNKFSFLNYVFGQFQRKAWWLWRFGWRQNFQITIAYWPNSTWRPQQRGCKVAHYRVVGRSENPGGYLPGTIGPPLLK